MKVFENIGKVVFNGNGETGIIGNDIGKIRGRIYNLCTGFPQNMLKTVDVAILKGVIVLFCVFFLFSCSTMKNLSFKGKPAPILESSLVNMTEEQVRKKIGEPSVVSMTPENHILWTYYGEWKVVPDNKDTVYLEFENGKVVKAMKAKR